jgi:hypothetical protein
MSRSIRKEMDCSDDNVPRDKLWGSQTQSSLKQPPAIAVELAKGFMRYMVKAACSGRGDDLVARSNQ